MDNNDKQLFLTKIIATLGPASESATTVRQLIQEGVRVFRINFSHGSLEDYTRMYNTVRAASEALDIPVAIMGDLSGPKIRVGKVEEGGVNLMRGSTVEFCKTEYYTTQNENSDIVRFSTTYPKFIDEVKVGERILLDDGNVLLKCLERNGKDQDEILVCVVIDGGLITSSKGVNLPDTDLSVPALTEKDYRCVEFAVKKQFDFLALSFVRQASDIVLLKEKLFELGARDKITEELYGGNVQTQILGGDYENFIPIISKIEKPQAIDNLEEILQQSDGIMVARGDLGVEMDLAEVAIHQKRIISMCHDWGVPVIVATQMLQSMIESPVPTRAEVSDVANAIFDGADAVMLSGETAVGKWPVETVRMMNRIAIKSNNYLLSKNQDVAALGKLRSAGYRNAALAHGVQTIVKDIETKYIAIWTKLGGGAVFLSQYRIPKPIIAFSESKRILQQMALLYGLVPIYMEQPKSGSQFIKNVDRLLQERGYARRGDGIIFAMGEPIDRVGVTNRLVIHFVGELD